MDDIETTTKKEVKVHKLPQEPHNQAETTKDIETIWRELGEKLDNSLRELARGKDDWSEAMSLMGENRFYQ